MSAKDGIHVGMTIFSAKHNIPSPAGEGRVRGDLKKLLIPPNPNFSRRESVARVQGLASH